MRGAVLGYLATPPGAFIAGVVVGVMLACAAVWYWAAHMLPPRERGHR